MGHDHCSGPAAHTIPDTSQDAVGLEMGSLRWVTVLKRILQCRSCERGMAREVRGLPCCHPPAWTPPRWPRSDPGRTAMRGSAEPTAAPARQQTPRHSRSFPALHTDVSLGERCCSLYHSVPSWLAGERPPSLRERKRGMNYALGDLGNRNPSSFTTSSLWHCQSLCQDLCWDRRRGKAGHPDGTSGRSFKNLLLGKASTEVQNMFSYIFKQII